MSDGTRRRLLVGGGLLGFGIGALVDVLVFHLVFQQHHLLSGYVDPTTLAGFRRNVVYDGLFSLLVLGMSAAGFVATWGALNRSERSHSPVEFLGAFVLGAGAFNLFDGVVDHYVLGLHDVVHATVAWNPHWVGVSVGLLVAGGLLLRWGNSDGR